jgi:hypothetical protein
VELYRRKNAVWLALLWLLVGVFFTVLLANSNEMQYDCFSFCDTVTDRSCSLLHATNGSDVSWRSSASACFDPSTSAAWGSEGSFSVVPPLINAVDVIPDMTSFGRRYNRFILRFLSTDYVIDPSRMTPQIQCLKLVDTAAHAVLATPQLLGVITPRIVFDLELSSQSGNAALIIELPVGRTFPEGTQQVVLSFPLGAPLTRLNASGASLQENRPVQLTFASSTPAYTFADMVTRYVLLVVAALVTLYVLCLHALGDPVVYAARDPSVPSPASIVSVCNPIFAVTVVGYVLRQESIRTMWTRQPKVVQLLVVMLCSIVWLCDPFAITFVFASGSNFLQFWALHFMPLLRFSWLAIGSSTILALMITSGDHGRLLTTHVTGDAATSSPTASRFCSSATWRIAAALSFFPTGLYLCSVIAAVIQGEPSSPSALGVANGYAMLGAMIGLQLVMPILVLGFWRFRRRMLYARYPRGIEDVDAIPLYGAPGDVRAGARPFVTWIRYVLPFWIWGMVFFAGVYFGVLIGISTLLPSYYNGHLVEVMLCALIGWTVALVSVPLRMPLSMYPPRPSLCVAAAHAPQRNAPSAATLPIASAMDDTPLLSAASSSNIASAVPLWTQLPWTWSYATNLATGAVPNLGYSFKSEAEQLSFDLLQEGSEYGTKSFPATTDVSHDAPQNYFNMALPPHPSTAASPRSFFCWETAVRALNMSNEAYNEVEGETDLSHLTKAEEYEKSACETCILHRCCCCVFGGCADSQCCCLFGDSLEGETLPVDAADGVDPTLLGSGALETDTHALRMSKSSRRFTEVGHVAAASRQSIVRRRAESTIVVIDADERKPADAEASPPPLEDRTNAFIVDDDATNCDITLHRDAQHPTADASPTPPGAKESPAATQQIDVSRFGYELIRVLDIYGVRVIIAATPPGTSGRHPHLCIAFRGTVNLRNALTDANARMVEHPEILGGAEVHRGFWNAFAQLLPFLVDALKGFFYPKQDDPNSGKHHQWTRSLTSIICTGHSLGGALAMLCAYSMSTGTLFRELFDTATVTHPRRRILCYTFGSPRLGNVRLSHAYNIHVPETYRVINENDLVARVGLCWQEHAGHEVRINRDGDAIIEGTWMEQEYTLTSGVGSSIKNHFLLRYGNSMDNVLCARNLNILSPDCCTFLMVHLDEDANE